MERVERVDSAAVESSGGKFLLRQVAVSLQGGRRVEEVEIGMVAKV